MEFGEAMGLINKGTVYMHQSKFVQSIDAFNQSIRILKEIGNNATVFDVWENIIEVYAKKETVKKRRRYLIIFKKFNTLYVMRKNKWLCTS